VSSLLTAGTLVHVAYCRACVCVYVTPRCTAESSSRVAVCCSTVVDTARNGARGSHAHTGQGRATDTTEPTPALCSRHHSSSTALHAHHSPALSATLANHTARSPPSLATRHSRAFFSPCCTLFWPASASTRTAAPCTLCGPTMYDV
jgi:hypothetical protein